MYGPEGGLTRNCSCSVLDQTPDNFYKEFVLYGDLNIPRLGSRPVGHAHSQNRSLGGKNLQVQLFWSSLNHYRMIPKQNRLLVYFSDVKIRIITIKILTRSLPGFIGRILHHSSHYSSWKRPKRSIMVIIYTGLIHQQMPRVTPCRSTSCLVKIHQNGNRSMVYLKPRFKARLRTKS